MLAGHKCGQLVGTLCEQLTQSKVDMRPLCQSRCTPGRKRRARCSDGRFNVGGGAVYDVVLMLARGWIVNWAGALRGAELLPVNEVPNQRHADLPDMNG